MSVFELALLEDHCQVLGSSVHLPPEKVLSLVELYRSMKWKVVAGLSGAPVASSTAPPLPVGPGNQSPVFPVGVLAWRSPSMANPPLGIKTGATPVGGGDACRAS